MTNVIQYLLKSTSQGKSFLFESVAMARKRRSSRLCYLCGKAGADSRDHVPPRGIFPKLPRGNLITVPAHKACNEAFSEDDEALRNVIIAASSRSEAGRQAWDEEVLPSFAKNPRARQFLLDRLVPVWVKDPQTGAFVRMTGIAVETSLYKRQMTRITRGLFYNRFRMPLPQDWPIKFHKMPPPEQSMRDLEALLARHGLKLRWQHVEPGIFSYYYGVVDEDNRIGIAVMVFFDTEVFWTKPGSGRGRHSN